MEATTELAPVPNSARAARQFVAGALGPHAADDRGLMDLLHEALLLTSEVVTNAIIYTKAPIGLSVGLTDECLRVVVRDESGDHPQRRPRGPKDHGGRGLMLLDTVSASWGVDPDDHGKAVWFELSR